MEYLKWVISLVVLVLAFPVGRWLASLTSEEMDSGRKWFKSIEIVSLIGVGVVLFLVDDFNLKMAIATTLLFICIVAWQGLKKAGHQL